MTSINTSNAISLQALLQKAKSSYTGPALRDAHPEGKASEVALPDARTAVDPNRNPLQNAHPTDTEAARAGNPTAREIQALDTAQKLVSTTLIKPLLAQARAARDAPAPWGQTQAEKQFGALLDNRIADDIAKASNFPIAQRIADNILSNSPVTDLPQQTHTPVDIFG